MNTSLIYSRSICIFEYKGLYIYERRGKRDRPSLIATSYIHIDLTVLARTYINKNQKVIYSGSVTLSTQIQYFSHLFSSMQKKNQTTFSPLFFTMEQEIIIKKRLTGLSCCYSRLLPFIDRINVDVE